MYSSSTRNVNHGMMLYGQVRWHGTLHTKILTKLDFFWNLQWSRWTKQANDLEQCPGSWRRGRAAWISICTNCYIPLAGLATKERDSWWTTLSPVTRSCSGQYPSPSNHNTRIRRTSWGKVTHMQDRQETVNQIHVLITECQFIVYLFTGEEAIDSSLTHVCKVCGQAYPTHYQLQKQQTDAAHRLKCSRPPSDTRKYSRTVYSTVVHASTVVVCFDQFGVQNRIKMWQMLLNINTSCTI